MYCHQCGAEYRTGFTRCADCGVELVDEPPAHRQRSLGRPPTYDQKLVVVGKCSTTFEAHLMQGALEIAGIRTVMNSDDAGGQYPGLAFAHGVELLVRAEDVAAARDILNAATSGEQ